MPRVTQQPATIPSTDPDLLGSTCKDARKKLPPQRGGVPEQRSTVKREERGSGKGGEQPGDPQKPKVNPRLRLLFPGTKPSGVN